MAKHHMNSSEH